MSTSFKPRIVGPLPVDVLGPLLGVRLPPGMVRVSATAHRHIAEDHPSDYALCWQTMPAIIADPTYAGLHPHHPQNFILVKQVVLTNSHAVLVAVGLNLNAGAYPVRTAYRIAATKIRTWLRAGTLRRVSS